MKNLRIVLMSLLVCSAVFMSSCGNSNQNSVAVNNNTESAAVANETTVIETKVETTKRTEETTTKADETTSEQVSEVQQNSNAVNEENEMPTNEVLVAYFSATGTTKRVAEKIAELTGADIYEIVPKNPYSDADLNWHDNNSRSTKEMNDSSVRPEIGSSDINLDQYKTIYLGYPIWWGDAPRIMATFVEKYNFDGKKVIPFCTSGGSGIGRSGSNLGNLAGSGSFANGERLNSSADTNNIQNFINNNK
ncbi:MAG: flavodoxin [Lachnospiraceae bacterium]|nr:flavodoxin [Lachnospiraceae bacterium]